MKHRHLGNLVASAVGLGCMGLSQGYGPTTREDAVRAIHAALEADVTMLDTAMSYGEGANEELVGAALRSAGSRGDTALVATKAGIVRTPEGVRVDAHPERLRGDALASLRRLDRDVIDLYYLHRVDPRFPVEEQVGALADLVEEGLVRAVGVSEVTAPQLEAATSTTAICAVQLEWSLAWRTPERDVIPAARRLGVPVVAYSPLGRGLLTADPISRDPANSAFRRNDPRFDAAHLGPNTDAAESLKRMALRLNLSAADLALAWLLHQGDDVVALPGSRRPERVHDNAAAADLELDAVTLTELNELAGTFVGNRHSFAVPTITRGKPTR